MESFLHQHLTDMTRKKKKPKRHSENFSTTKIYNHQLVHRLYQHIMSFNIGFLKKNYERVTGIFHLFFIYFFTKNKKKRKVSILTNGQDWK